MDYRLAFFVLNTKYSPKIPSYWTLSLVLYAPGFLKLFLCGHWCVCLCVHPWGYSRLVVWYGLHMIWLNKFYSFYMGATVDIGSGHGLRIEAHHVTQWE